MKRTMLFATTISLAAGLAAGGVQAQSADYDSQLLPPDPKPGECYARVHVPATTRQVAKRVMTKEAADELVVRAARYEWVEKVVELEGASERLEVVPARYEMRKQTVVIEPDHEKVVSVPAEYEEVTERVLVRQSYTEWKKGEGPIQRIDSATGEIMCLVTVPAQYKTVTKRVVKRPARVERQRLAAKTREVEVKVMVEPPRTRLVRIPAKTQTVRVKQLIQPTRVERRSIPASFATVMETVKESESRVEWRPILCQTNAKPDLIRDLQLALKNRGYNPGLIVMLPVARPLSRWNRPSADIVPRPATSRSRPWSVWGSIRAAKDCGNGSCSALVQGAEFDRDMR